MNSTIESPQLQYQLSITKFLSIVCIILAFVLFFGGCMTSNQLSESDHSDFQDNEKAAMDSWLGHTKQELIMPGGHQQKPRQMPKAVRF